MTRCAAERRVFFIEEPVFDATSAPVLTTEVDNRVTVVVPHLPEGMGAQAAVEAQRTLLQQLMRTQQICEYVLWYYTPMALDFTDRLSPRTIVYDCMDELSGFKGAPAALKQREAELLGRASLVLTGGQSLYEAKRHAHRNIYPFPSSVDAAHFGQARLAITEPSDQSDIPSPRLGFFGVIDERMDLELIAAVAAARPDWHVVLLGPIAKIEPSSLPRLPNIHYLGPKRYQDLPSYLAGWNVALMPFARNDATRFISPTKTPEYMAAGKPVVSTSIRDVVRPYGQQGLVRIADDAASFVRACADAMAEDPLERRRRNDAFLRLNSWDITWQRIRALIETASGAPQRDAVVASPGRSVQLSANSL